MSGMPSSIVSYSPDKSTEHKNVKIADSINIKDAVVWLDLKNPSDDELKELENAYELHPLAIEDCREVQRPKIELYDKYFFLVAMHIEYDKGVNTKQLSVFVGKNYLISVHKEEIEFLDTIKKTITEGGHKVNKYGPDYLLYKIVDKIVDNYFVVLDVIEDNIEVIESEVVKKPTKAVLKNVFKTKKDLLLIRKPIWPLREVLHTIQSGTIKTISDKTLLYFRDVYDHMINVIDLIETYRELVTTALETYLSSVNNSLNEIMKVLTVISSLVLFPTLVASIYGMNFRIMPELGWVYGYPFALFIMLSSMILMYAYFKKRKWA